MPTPRRGYHIDGVKVPSVTQVLGCLNFTPTDALCQWAGKLAVETGEAGAWRKSRDRSGKVGTAVHDIVEHYPAPAVRPDWATDEEWQRMQRAWDDHDGWFQATRPTIVLQEVQLVSRKLRVGGTPDLVVRIADPVGEAKLYLVDHKTSKSLDAKAVAQVAAYAAMVEENNDVAIDGAIILHHSVASGFKDQPITRAQLDQGLEAFKAARIVYDLVGPLKEAVGAEAWR